VRVQTEIGPVSAASARAWLATATETVEHLGRTPSLGVPADIVEAFAGYLSRWTEAATSVEVFHWRGEVDTADLRHLAAHWVRLVNLAREDPEGSGLRTAPPEAEPFFDALAVTLATALEQDDDPEEFADKFEELVPDFQDGSRRPTVDQPPIRVLLVDDTPDIRMLVRVGLDLDGRFEVTGEAGDGAEALAACSGECPDVVLLDISMPVLDGLEALPRLREACPDAAVVMFSANNEQAQVQRAAELGAAAFLPKHTSITALADVLAGVAS
jgi:CheY-like chemotaxis protein